MLRRLQPDVVLLHDPFWHPHDVVAAAHEVDAKVVMVHHGSVDLDAHAFAGPKRLYQHAFRVWLHRAYAPADAVMSACDPWADTGRHAGIPLRFGLHPAFRPDPSVTRGDRVLYVGRLGREKGIFELLDAAALSREPWRLDVIGAGTACAAVEARVKRLGLEKRVSFRPYVADRRALARAYAAARCVVMPGAYETFGLVAFEAAASGASTVACTTAPSAHVLGPLAHTFPPGDVEALLAAIERARAAEPDHDAAADLAAEHTWARAFAAELADLGALA
jgi:glycosyltransferase involved in cell wall biosynthesis